jgi:hypothetical protein
MSPDKGLDALRLPHIWVAVHQVGITINHHPFAGKHPEFRIIWIMVEVILRDFSMNPFPPSPWTGVHRGSGPVRD